MGWLQDVFDVVRGLKTEREMELEAQLADLDIKIPHQGEPICPDCGVPGIDKGTAGTVYFHWDWCPRMQNLTGPTGKSTKTREQLIAEIESELLDLPKDARTSPMFSSWNGETLSPQQIVDEIKADTELGRSFLQQRMKLEGIDS